MNRIGSRIAGVFLTVLPLVLSAGAGTIKGKVTDPDGNPVAEVRIILRDMRGEMVYSFETGRNGRYVRKGVDPTEYLMKLDKEGFIPLEGRIVVASEGETVRDAVLATLADRPDRPDWERTDVAAKRLYKEGRYEDALALYRSILSDYPGLARIHFYVGNCLFHLERYEEALAVFVEAVRLKPDFFEAYTNLAGTANRLNRFDEALLELERALAACPEDPGLLSTAGRLYLVSGRSEIAAEYLEKAASLDPDARDHFYSLGVARARQGDLAGAVRAYEKFVALNTDPAEKARVRGIIERLTARQKK